MAEVRICLICKCEKTLDLFPPDWVSPTRKTPKKVSYCKDCSKSYQRKRYGKWKEQVYWNKKETERRIRYKEEAIRLMGGKCQDCGKIYPTVVYDFHHINPEEKEHNPAKVFQRKWEVVKTEVIQKCVLLCANCHRIRHYEKGSPKL